MRIFHLREYFARILVLVQVLQEFRPIHENLLLLEVLSTMEQYFHFGLEFIVNRKRQQDLVPAVFFKTYIIKTAI